MVTDSEVLMIQSYFQKEQNIGKSIKAQKCDIDKQKTKKIPLNTIRKILRKGGIYYATRNGWQKKLGITVLSTKSIFTLIVFSKCF